MEIEVLKIEGTPNSTLSKMRIDGAFFCFVIEDGYRAEKIPGETRIPDGRYRIVKRTVGSFYERYRKAYGHKFAIQVEGVPNFEFILFHTGNKVSDTRGCSITGDAAGKEPGGNFFIPAGFSTNAYLRFYDAVEKAFDSGDEIWATFARGE